MQEEGWSAVVGFNHHFYRSPARPLQSATVTRKNVAGIDVESLRVLLF
jgi:hypothetical protein